MRTKNVVIMFVQLVTWCWISGCLGPIVGAECEPGLVGCKRGCVQLDNDANNCGACDNQCASDEHCRNGVCLRCAPHETDCNGNCIDTQTSHRHCGSCDNACATDERCLNGECIPCPDGQQRCGDACVSTASDPTHCGQCDTPCTSDMPFCINGICTPDCPTWMTVCDDRCVNTTNDNEHCGACFNQCPQDTPTCHHGICVATCPSPLTECAGTCVDLQTTSEHCGGCEITCHPGRICIAGECVIDCGQHQIICDGECVSVLSDPLHCGQCNTSCAHDEICSKGVCELDCKNLKLCSDTCVDILSDNRHCGACNTPCDSTHYCVDGICRLDCPPSHAACGDLCVNLNHNPLHCGDCNSPCESGICVDGECKNERPGHIILIGHDYASSIKMMDRIIANSVFMVQTSPVRVLGYTQYADTLPEGQVDATRAAIDAISTETGRSWVHFEAPTVATIEEQLLSHDILLVYQQENTSDAQLTTVGSDIEPHLRDFLSIGGIIVLTDGGSGNSGSWQLLHGADLMDIDGIHPCIDCTVEITDPGDAIVQGVSTYYAAWDNSVAFVTSEPDVVALDNATGLPVLIHKVFLSR